MDIFSRLFNNNDDNSIIINGVQYQSGGNITINGNSVIVDGKKIDTKEKNINIQINGNIKHLKVDYAEKIRIEGNVGDVDSSSGDVEITGDVTGDASSGSGNIKCNDVGNDVDTGSGNVNCGNVAGDVSTGSGNIKHK